MPSKKPPVPKRVTQVRPGKNGTQTKTVTNNYRDGTKDTRYTTTSKRNAKEAQGVGTQFTRYNKNGSIQSQQQINTVNENKPPKTLPHWTKRTTKKSGPR